MSYQIVLTKADKLKAGEVEAVVERTPTGDRSPSGRLSARARDLGGQGPGAGGTAGRDRPGGVLVSAAAEEAGWATAKTLAEALPFIQIYDRQTVVIKYGGHAMGEEELARLFAADAVLLKLLGAASGGGARRRTADLRACWSGPASSRPSSTACGSPTRRPWRWPKWSSPGRSTRKSPAGSPRPGRPPTCAASACPARTPG